MNLGIEIRKFAAAHDGREPDELAAMFIRGCTTDDLLPLVVDEFKWVIRSTIRAMEIQTLTKRPIRKLADTRQILADLTPLLDKPYRVGDGHPRRFGSMTTEEHEKRIVMLKRNVAGLERDIELHEEAIEVIARHGVGCLDEIDIAKAA